MARYRIVGSYQGRQETVEPDIHSLKEAIRLLGEYRLAFGYGWALWIMQGKNRLDY
jgi:hypothetical protein